MRAQDRLKAGLQTFPRRGALSPPRGSRSNGVSIAAPALGAARIEIKPNGCLLFEVRPVRSCERTPAGKPNYLFMSAKHFSEGELADDPDDEAIADWVARWSRRLMRRRHQHLSKAELAELAELRAGKIMVGQNHVEKTVELETEQPRERGTTNVGPDEAA